MTEHKVNTYGCIRSRPSPDDVFIKFTREHVTKYVTRMGLNFTDEAKPIVYDVTTTLNGGLPACQHIIKLV
jgi:hypothetical protein